MKMTKIIPFFLIPFFITGCWDKTEIDRKNFISNIAIDVGKEINKSKELKKLKPDAPFAERQIKKLSVTYSFPNISKSGTQNITSAEDEVIETEAYSMEDSVTEANRKSSRSLHFGHDKFLIFSSEILGYKDIMKEIVDYLNREPALNRMAYVVVCDGKAQDYLKFAPTMEKNLENYLTGLMESSQKNASIVPITLNKFLILIAQNGNAIIPRITYDKDKNEIKLVGVGMIKDYKLQGFLDPMETEDLEILSGKAKAAKKVIYVDGHPIDFVIGSIEKKISVSESKGKLIFNVNLDLEGELKNYYIGKQPSENYFIEYMQNNFNKAIKSECKKVVKMTQREYGVDIVGFREYVEKYKPAVWNKIKDNWEERFKEAQLNINVDTKIRRVGVSE